MVNHDNFTQSERKYDLVDVILELRCHRNNAFNLCPWFGQSRISLDNVILSLDNVMTFLISSPILDNVAWFRLSTPDYGQFCTFSYISQNIMDNSVPFVSETFRSKEVGLSWCFGWVPKICRKWEMMSTIFYPLTAGVKLDVYFHFLAFSRIFFADSVSVSIPSKVGICFETNLSVRGKTCLSNA